MRSSKIGIAPLLRSARQLCGLTLRQVEKQTGISNAYLCQLENGRTTNPSPHMLSKLARVYGLPHSELMAAAGYSEGAPADATTLKFAMLTSRLNWREQRKVELFIRTLLTDRNSE